MIKARQTPDGAFVLFRLAPRLLQNGAGPRCFGSELGTPFGKPGGALRCANVLPAPEADGMSVEYQIPGRGKQLPYQFIGPTPPFQCSGRPGLSIFMSGHGAFPFQPADRIRDRRALFFQLVHYSIDQKRKIFNGRFSACTLPAAGMGLPRFLKIFRTWKTPAKNCGKLQTVVLS